jgi:hypothetical protein
MKNLIFLDSKVKMPLMELPVRSVLVPMGEQGVLISPGSMLQDHQYKPDWKVTDLVAPNLFHNAGMTKAKQHYPSAVLWGSEGADKKLPGLPWGKFLGKDPWPYQDVLSLVTLHGMPSVNESVFIHRPTKSLIVTDLCFNMVDVEGLGAKIILGLFGTYKKLGVSRFFLAGIKDKAAFQKSLVELFSYDFDQIIVSHGSNVVSDGKDRLRFALRERGFEVGVKF